MILRSTKIIFFFSLIFFLISIITCTAFVYNVYTEKQAYIEKRNKLLEIEDKSEKLVAFTNTFEHTVNERAYLETRILDDQKVIDFLEMLEMLEQEQEVTMTTSSLNVQKIDATFDTLTTHITIEGQNESVLNVIKILETLPYQSSVERVQFTKKEDGDGAYWWTAELDLRITKFSSKK